jgi:hypothetical protein
MVEALAIKEGMLGAFLSGRWTPDLPSGGAPSLSDWLASVIDVGAKVVGGGLCGVGDPKHKQQPFVRLCLGNTVVNVLPGLLARLVNYSCFRQRGPSLLAALRTRAVEWCKENHVLDVDSALCMPGTVALAYCKSGPEVAAEGLLRSVAAGVAEGNAGLVTRFLYQLSPWSTTVTGVVPGVG